MLDRVVVWFSPVRMRSALSIGETKILPSPIRPGLRGSSDASTTRSAMVVGDDHLELHLGQEVDDIFSAAIELCVAFLATEALGFGDSDAGYADFVQRLLHLVELEGFDDRFDLFHVAFVAILHDLAGPDDGISSAGRLRTPYAVL